MIIATKILGRKVSCTHPSTGNILHDPTPELRTITSLDLPISIGPLVICDDSVSSNTYPTNIDLCHDEPSLIKIPNIIGSIYGKGIIPIKGDYIQSVLGI